MADVYIADALTQFGGGALFRVITRCKGGLPASVLGQKPVPRPRPFLLPKRFSEFGKTSSYGTLVN